MPYFTFYTLLHFFLVSVFLSSSPISCKYEHRANSIELFTNFIHVKYIIYMYYEDEDFKVMYYSHMFEGKGKNNGGAWRSKQQNRNSKQQTANTQRSESKFVSPHFNPKLSFSIYYLVSSIYREKVLCYFNFTTFSLSFFRLSCIFCSTCLFSCPFVTLFFLVPFFPSFFSRVLFGLVGWLSCDLYLFFCNMSIMTIIIIIVTTTTRIILFSFFFFSS